jgi:hypothetical protein
MRLARARRDDRLIAIACQRGGSGGLDDDDDDRCCGPWIAEALRKVGIVQQASWRPPVGARNREARRAACGGPSISLEATFERVRPPGTVVRERSGRREGGGGWKEEKGGGRTGS